MLRAGHGVLLLWLMALPPCSVTRLLSDGLHAPPTGKSFRQDVERAWELRRDHPTVIGMTIALGSGCGQRGGQVTPLDEHDEPSFSFAASPAPPRRLPSFRAVRTRSLYSGAGYGRQRRSCPTPSTAQPGHESLSRPGRIAGFRQRDRPTAVWPIPGGRVAALDAEIYNDEWMRQHGFLDEPDAMGTVADLLRRRGGSALITARRGDSIRRVDA